MNLLVYDDPPTIGHLLRAALAGGRHRASSSASVGDAKLKLDTGLFDAVILGASGAPREVAEHLEHEHPALPIVLAGVAREIPCVDPIAACLVRPIRIGALHASLRLLERRLEAARAAHHDVPVDLVLGERRLACRVVRRSAGRLLLEAVAGCPLEGLPDGIEAGLQRAVEGAAEPIRASGRVLFHEGRRLVAVGVDDEALAASLS